MLTSPPSTRVQARRHDQNGHCWGLHYGKAQTALVYAVPDERWPAMFRLRWSDGSASDLVNLTRAKDAAAAICERGPPRRDPRLLRWEIDAHETPAKTSPARFAVLEAAQAGSAT